MIKQLLIAAALAATGTASAAPITGSFSILSFGGSFIGGTTATATGLDFGTAFGSTGNGFGTRGTALIGNGSGAFSTLAGSMASISDIALGAVANPFASNPFISFGNSPIVFSFANASYTRDPAGLSLTLTGAGTFSDGILADTTVGTFSLTTSSQGGSPSAIQFTFTGNFNAVPAAVPEPMSLALVGIGLAGLGLARRRKTR